MSTPKVPTKNVTFRTVNWLAHVERAWGGAYKRQDTVYVFSNGRKFLDSGNGHGIYKSGLS